MSTGHVLAQSDAASAPAGAAVTDDNALADIVVTAQRREEHARDVPISLTVLSAENLADQGITSVQQLTDVTPGLRMDRNGISTQPSIRGITTLDGNPGNDNNVATYVDGVYRPNSAASSFDLPDVDRIEVLEGPQGTLFGRNATGGAIRIQTLSPSFTTSGNVSIGYGSFNDVVAKGFITGGLIDGVVAGSLAAFHEKSDGYLYDVANDNHEIGGLSSSLVRGKLLIQPVEGLTILLSTEYMQRHDSSTAGQPFDGNTVARLTPGAIIPTRPWEVATEAGTSPPGVNVTQYVPSATVTYDFGPATLTSISAYTHMNLYSPVEDDYTNIYTSMFFTTNFERTFSQELTLASNGNGPLKWTTGLFYYLDQATYDPLGIDTPTSTFNIYGDQHSRAYAGFGEVTDKIVGGLSLTLGLRYSNERRYLSGEFVTRDFPQIASKDFPSTTPRVVLAYAINDTTNTYASYSRGFKSGGYTASALSPVAFRPETVDAYEIGVKSAPIPTLEVDASAFYYNYKDEQVQTAVELPSGVTVGSTANAASARIYGAELQATWHAFSGFSVSNGLSVLHARYRSFPDAYVQTPVTVGGVPCQCGNVGTTVDASGNQLVRAPDLTDSLTGEYQMDTSIGKFRASSTVYYSDKFFFTPDNRVGQPAYTTLEARLAYEPESIQGLKFTIWGRNLTNRVVYQGASILPDADAVFFAPRRAAGVEAAYHF